MNKETLFCVIQTLTYVMMENVMSRYFPTDFLKKTFAILFGFQLKTLKNFKMSSGYIDMKTNNLKSVKVKKLKK